MSQHLEPKWLRTARVNRSHIHVDMDSRRQSQGPTTAGIMTSSRCDKHSGRKPSISGGGAYPWLGPLGSILCLLRDGSVAEALGTSGPEVPGTAQVSSRGRKDPRVSPGPPRCSPRPPRDLPDLWGCSGFQDAGDCTGCLGALVVQVVQSLGEM